ncbi:acylphosphatase [bacterium]|nr:acylphosphatase [bacterium]|tara:strand:- start:2536 stop:2811 length:276 start_codon:yes stop_codon:yes gene_type:complete
MKKQIRCRITGKVQLVMYRDFVQRKARALGIVGTVENKKDRSVEVVAQGTEEDLKKLIKHLHKGSLLARVARVDVEWREPNENFKGFKILY